MWRERERELTGMNDGRFTLITILKSYANLERGLRSKTLRTHILQIVDYDHNFFLCQPIVVCVLYFLISSSLLAFHCFFHRTHNHNLENYLSFHGHDMYEELCLLQPYVIWGSVTWAIERSRLTFMVQYSYPLSTCKERYQ